jgi:hypothetical protein
MVLNGFRIDFRALTYGVAKGFSLKCGESNEIPKSGLKVLEGLILDSTN